MSSPLITPLGDTLLTVTLGEGISEDLNALVVARAAQIAEASLIGVTDVVPSYAALGVHYDPLVTGFADLRDRVAEIMESDPAAAAVSDSRLHTIPVRYDGPDLDEVARRTGLEPRDVIEIHQASVYRVFVIGFVPGFGYLGPLDARLSLPRRDSPRQRVPAGSVAIAERQTAIYPSVTPGGWHLIGSTDAIMFDPSREQPSILRAGDSVKFEPQ
jgi:KipI family sensor histidine kinase inhibitor